MMKDKVNKIIESLNNNEKNSVIEELKNDKEYQEILEGIQDLKRLSKEEIVEKFGLVDDEDYTIDEQIEDLPRILDYKKSKKEGNLKLYTFEEVRKRLSQ